MSGIEERLRAVEAKVDAACLKRGCARSEVTLITVSKTYPSEDIQRAYDLGQTEFGESRIQEAAQKVVALPPEIEWHFIGRVQRNKVRKILPLFPYIHAVDSLKLACRIDTVAGEMGIKPKIFLQVNQADEPSKAGFSVEVLFEVFEEIMVSKHLKVVGLMNIPPAVKDAEESRKWFLSLRLLRDELESRFGCDLPSLSMGMSRDYPTAIEEGATHVRVGSAIFGNRERKIEGELG